MNVITLVDFHDNLKDVDRKRGEEFTVSRERYEEINEAGDAQIGKPLVAEVKRKQVPEERAQKARSRRRTAKAGE